MKILRLVLAVLAALWTIGVAVGVAKDFGRHGGTRGMVEMVGGAAVTLAMLALTIWLFQGIFRKPSSRP